MIYFFPAAWLRARLAVTAIAPTVEPIVRATSVRRSGAADGCVVAVATLDFVAQRLAHFFAGRFAVAFFVVPLLFEVAITSPPNRCCGAVYDKNGSP
jgi:hypothetical protein